MKWAVAKHLEAVIPYPAIIAQCVEAAFASHLVDPCLVKQFPRRVYAVHDVVLRHDDRLDAELFHRVFARLALVPKLADGQIVWEIVVAVNPLMSLALLIEDASIFIEPNTTALVIIDQAKLLACLLNKPDSGRVADTQIPAGMNKQSTINRDLANPPILGEIGRAHV